MDAQFEPYAMRPGDTFVADECGCSFTVESGPRQESGVRQAPVCCCGHAMHKESHSASSGVSMPVDERSSIHNVPGPNQKPAGTAGTPAGH